MKVLSLAVTVKGQSKAKLIGEVCVCAGRLGSFSSLHNYINGSNKHTVVSRKLSAPLQSQLISSTDY